jgi:8-hydroxy-5-deazaflavin:NADPH oxidoreductase
MKIGIIGKGNMGGALAELAKNAGHHVTIGSRDPNHPVLDAIKDADIVILAVKYETALELVDLPAIRTALQGKVVVDITNPLAPNTMGLIVGHTSSAAEEIAKRLPGVNVVKAFNNLFASVLKSRIAGEKIHVPVMVAADNENAKKMIVELAESIGFEAIESGPLSNSRYIEALTALQIQFAFVMGKGTNIGFALVKAA